MHQEIIQLDRGVCRIPDAHSVQLKYYFTESWSRVDRSNINGDMKMLILDPPPKKKPPDGKFWSAKLKKI